ncbi:IclR family transcriptional regulator [Streptomyces sp. Y7]|uniref:IclR family transcriptional regulator n=1 Tax=Streptomyces sp. Y7 TaxID=3342392 RepID=UPI0037246AA9
MTDEPTRLTPGVSSPRRALQMLLSFDAENPRATPAELAQRMELPMSSIYRYISLFRELDLLEEDEESSALQVTPRILPVARAAIAVQDFVRVAQPHLEALSAEVGETVMLMRQSGAAAVCMSSVVSSHALRLDFGVGHTFPFGSGATTKVLLAAMSPEERARHLDERVRVDSGFAGRREAFEAEIAEAEQQGWATSEEELEPGVWACAAGIVRHGQRPGAVTVAGPVFRLSTRDRRQVIDKVRATAVAIENMLTNNHLAQDASVVGEVRSEA